MNNDTKTPPPTGKVTIAPGMVLAYAYAGIQGLIVIKSIGTKFVTFLTGDDTHRMTERKLAELLNHICEEGYLGVVTRVLSVSEIPSVPDTRITSPAEACEREAEQERLEREELFDE